MVEDSQAQHIEIELAYDGPALADGTMNVRDLAPAMFAVGDLFESANLVFNGRTATVDVSLWATHGGSFHVIFNVILEVVGTLMSAGLPNGWKSASDLKDLLFGPEGLIGLAVARKAPANRDVQRLQDNDLLIRSVNDILRPLGQTGIHTLNILVGGQPTLTINQNYYGQEPGAPTTTSTLLVDSSALAWQSPQTISDETATTELLVISPVYQPTGKMAFQGRQGDGLLR